MSRALRRDLSLSLQQLLGLPCWEVLAGKGTGSNFTMHLGRRVKRDRPLTNRTLSNDAKHYEGQYVFYIQCPWRLETRSATVASWADAWKNLDGMLSGLARLKRARVSRVALRDPALDLRITFDNALSLVVFCDVTEATAGDSCYDFFDSRTSYSVLGDGRVERESRSDGTPG